VAFGPVLDPAGVYGLARVAAIDEAERATVADADPVIRADAGFRSRSRR
jgi:hypothetical protein